MEMTRRAIPLADNGFSGALGLVRPLLPFQRRNSTQGRERMRFLSSGSGRARPAAVLPACRPVTVAAAIAALLLLTAPARSQIQWLNFEDGDILNVSSASGPPPGHFLLRATRGLEKSKERGRVLSHHFLFHYGLSSHVSLGASGVHLQQRRGDLYKDGLGDTDLFLKMYFQPSKDLPFYLGLRQSLSLPTGYEPERPGLVSFTSRKNDYSAQLLFSYRTRGVEAHLNPGVILPGGDSPSYLTAGGGLALRELLPLGVNVEGEYFTRWNMVAEEFESDVFVALDRSLAWGLDIEAGFKRRLLQQTAIDPEWRLGLSFGRAHAAQAELYEMRRPDRPPVRLVVLPVETVVPDPFGVSQMLGKAFRTAGAQSTPAHVVYLDTDPDSDSRPPYPSPGYRLRVRLLEIDEGRVTGWKVPMLVKAPRAKTSLAAQIELVEANGIPAARHEVLRVDASRGLGAELAPTSTVLETIIVPDEVKDWLRQRAVGDLAERILETAGAIIDGRDSR